LVWRRESDAGHWIIRTHAEQVAAWVRDVIAFVNDGTETDDMARCRFPFPADVPNGSVAT
jgi:hypothetical protein